MTGWLRLERFHVISDRLCAAGVFTGELVDSNGTTIGVGSRRRTVPAEIARSLHDRAVVIGPVDVDLLGLTVSIPAFTMDTGVLRRPPMKPDAERFDARIENVTHHMDDQEQEGFPKDRTALGRTKLQEMDPCMVALRKTALPQSGSTQCVEKGRGRRHRVTLTPVVPTSIQPR